MKTQTLIETIDFSEAQVDSETRTIRNVVLIRAGMSANKRMYRPEVLAAAVSVFEDSQAYANHPTKEEIKTGRNIRDLTGWYKNVRFENGALVADRHFTGTDAGRDVFAIASDIAEKRAPNSLAGLSINAVGLGKMSKDADGDFLDVESITHSFSVDDVTTPAAGGGYRLTAGHSDLASALLETLDYEDWFHCKPEFTERLQKEMKTVRQDDALKAALAEAEGLTETVNTLTTELTEAKTAREAAEAQVTEARRELAVFKLVAKSGLPTSWREGVQGQLMKADPDEWDSILTTEIKKARASGAHRVNVTGADVQRQADTPPLLVESPMARPNENAVQWLERVNKLRG